MKTNSDVYKNKIILLYTYNMNIYFYLYEWYARSNVGVK